MKLGLGLGIQITSSIIGGAVVYSVMFDGEPVLYNGVPITFNSAT